MNSKILRIILGEGDQRRKEAVEETAKKVKDIRLSDSSKDIDQTIAYLIENKIDVNYKVF